MFSYWGLFFFRAKFYYHTAGYTEWAIARKQNLVVYNEYNMILERFQRFTTILSNMLLLSRYLKTSKATYTAENKQLTLICWPNVLWYVNGHTVMIAIYGYNAYYIYWYNGSIWNRWSPWWSVVILWNKRLGALFLFANILSFLYCNILAI